MERAQEIEVKPSFPSQQASAFIMAQAVSDYFGRLFERKPPRSQ